MIYELAPEMIITKVFFIYGKTHEDTYMFIPSKPAPKPTVD